MCLKPADWHPVYIAIKQDDTLNNEHMIQSVHQQSKDRQTHTDRHDWMYNTLHSWAAINICHIFSNDNTTCRCLHWRQRISISKYIWARITHINISPHCSHGLSPCIMIILQHDKPQVNPLKPNSSNCYTLPYRPHLPFLISDIRARRHSALSARVTECQKLKMVG